MDNDYYHSSDYKIQLNEEPVESTPYNGGLDNISEMPVLPFLLLLLLLQLMILKATHHHVQ